MASILACSIPANVTEEQPQKQQLQGLVSENVPSAVIVVRRQSNPAVLPRQVLIGSVERGLDDTLPAAMMACMLFSASGRGTATTTGNEPLSVVSPDVPAPTSTIMVSSAPRRRKIHTMLMTRSATADTDAWVYPSSSLPRRARVDTMKTTKNRTMDAAKLRTTADPLIPNATASLHSTCAASMPVTVRSVVRQQQHTDCCFTTTLRPETTSSSRSLEHQQLRHVDDEDSKSILGLPPMPRRRPDAAYAAHQLSTMSSTSEPLTLGSKTPPKVPPLCEMMVMVLLRFVHRYRIRGNTCDGRGSNIKGGSDTREIRSARQTTIHANLVAQRGESASLTKLGAKQPPTISPTFSDSSPAAPRAIAATHPRTKKTKK